MENQLLDWSLRAALMAAGTAVVLIALRVRTPAARHVAWTGVLVAMLLLPILTTWGPKARFPALPATREQPPQEAPVPEEILMRPAPQHAEDKGTPDAFAVRSGAEAASPGHERRWSWSWRLIALACYFVGLGVMVIRLAAGVIQVRKLARRATFVDGALVSAQCAAPVTVGWLRPVVIFPENWRSWPEAKLDAVLTHEREHVRRRDPLVQLLALLNRCVFWFHPLAWWLERKLSNLAEEACDAVALRRGHTPTDYSQYLIEMARCVEEAGGRVGIRGPAINGGALEVRIRRILDSRLPPLLSRTRSSMAAALCLFVLAVFSACKQERAPAVAPGQPSMNELMHKKVAVWSAENQTREKKQQALMDEIQKLTSDQAKALEEELKANPRDNEKLSKLTLYYQYRLGGQGFSAIALWYIEHEPTIPWAWNINPEWDREGYEQGKRLWLAHLKKPGAEPAIYRNAARFLEGGDKPLAEQVLLDGQKAYPNEKWAMEFGDHYAQALLGSVGPLAEFNVIRAVSMKEAHGAYARSVRKKLAASNDPQLLMQTAQSLTYRGMHFLSPRDKRNKPLDFEFFELAGSFNNRALSLQPDFPAALWLKLTLDSFTTGERIRNTPPDKLSQSDRMWQLSNQMERLFVEKKLDESESKARELLDLAAKNTRDPEYGNAIFFANLTLGNVALRRGDKREAARHLLAASGAPPTDRLRYGYIDMTLARQLMDWGEREAVAQFLDHCARFSQRSEKLAEWAAQIRKGINPDLTPYRSS